MAALSVHAPSVGARVEMRRPDGDFEPATVVDRFDDAALGIILELQFGDDWRMQRVWPAIAIRLAG
jgi:hypothetical protein